MLYLNPEMDLQVLLSSSHEHHCNERNVRSKVEKMLSFLGNNDISSTSMQQVLSDEEDVSTRNACLLSLALIAMKNPHYQKLLTTPEIFKMVQSVLNTDRSDHSDYSLLVSGYVFLLATLLIHNGTAQHLVRELGCLKCLIHLYQSSFPKHAMLNDLPLDENKREFDESLTLWNSVNVALCLAVNAPQNEENQHMVADLFPFVLENLKSSVHHNITKSLAMFLSSAITKNVQNQNLISDLKGLDTIKRCFLEECECLSHAIRCHESTTTQEHILLAILGLVNALEAAITDHAQNAREVGKGILVLLFDLLHLDILQLQMKTYIIVFLNQYLETCRLLDENATILWNEGALLWLTKASKSTQDPEFKAAANKFLNLCSPFNVQEFTEEPDEYHWEHISCFSNLGSESECPIFVLKPEDSNGNKAADQMNPVPDNSIKNDIPMKRPSQTNNSSKQQCRTPYSLIKLTNANCKTYPSASQCKKLTGANGTMMTSSEFAFQKFTLSPATFFNLKSRGNEEIASNKSIFVRDSSLQKSTSECGSATIGTISETDSNVNEIGSCQATSMGIGSNMGCDQKSSFPYSFVASKALNSKSQCIYLSKDSDINICPLQNQGNSLKLEEFEGKGNDVNNSKRHLNGIAVNDETEKSGKMVFKQQASNDIAHNFITSCVLCSSCCSKCSISNMTLAGLLDAVNQKASVECETLMNMDSIANTTTCKSILLPRTVDSNRSVCSASSGCSQQIDLIFQKPALPKSQSLFCNALLETDTKPTKDSYYCSSVSDQWFLSGNVNSMLAKSGTTSTATNIFKTPQATSIQGSSLYMEDFQGTPSDVVGKKNITSVSIATPSRKSHKTRRENRRSQVESNQNTLDKENLCPGCQPPSRLNGVLLNSINYNLVLETSFFTCQKHRQEREMERKQIAKMKYVLKQITACEQSSDFSGSRSNRNVTQSSLHSSRIPFSTEEDRILLKVAEKMQRDWNRIHWSYDFHPSRTPSQLCERYLHLQHKKQEKNEDTQNQDISGSLKVPFALCEDRRLLRGVKTYGVNWRMILKRFKFASHRTESELRERWKSLLLRNK